MSFLNDKDKRRAFIVTVIFHSLLLVSLLFMALVTPLPLPGEEGVEVDLGYSDQGVGWEQPDVSVPESALPPIPKMQPEQPEAIEEEVVTTSEPEAPKIEEIKEEKPEEKPEIKQEKEIEQPEEVLEELEEVEEIPEEIPEEPKPVVNQRALFKGATSSNEQSSEGITGKPGDQGRPDGLKDVKRYDGEGGKGKGKGFDLAGRGAKNLVVPSDDFSESGTVVVEIWVDKNGIVKNAKVLVGKIDSEGNSTNTIDAKMRNIAVRAALNSTFSEDPKATELQKGTITYTFIIRK